MTNYERLRIIEQSLQAAILKLNSFTFSPQQMVRLALEDVRLANAQLQELDNILAGIMPPQLTK